MEDDKYDVIICGTGIVECLLSNLLAQSGKRILHIDRNTYYGGQSTTLNFNDLWQKFKGSEPLPNYYDWKQKHHWNVDLIQKFALSRGNLVKMLMKVKANKYMEWKIIDSTLVYKQKQGGCFFKGSTNIEKVPFSQNEILNSSLMGLFEKRRYIKFLQFLKQLDLQNSKTFNNLSLNEMDFQQVVNSFQLENTTVEFIAHVLGQYNNDMFYYQPALQVLNRIQNYLNSYGVFSENAFIYPIYGITEICQATARLIAIYGSTMMLNFEISEFLFNQNGKVCAIKPSGETQKQLNVQSIQCDFIIADPTYICNTKLAPRIRLIGHTLRCICILNHPFPNKKLTSGLIIIPASQIGRNSDIYITLLDDSFKICQKGYYICSIHANAETQHPEQELEPAFQIIGGIIDKFLYITEDYEPVQKYKDNLFITSTLNSTAQFEQDLEQVFDIYKAITGKDLDLNNLDDEKDFQD